MKVRPSVKPMCEKCKVIKRKGRVVVICSIQSISNVRANIYLMEVQLNGTYCRCRLTK